MNLMEIPTKAEQLREMRHVLSEIINEAVNQEAGDLVDLAEKLDEMMRDMLRREIQ
jgi:hypothetical protein